MVSMKRLSRRILVLINISLFILAAGLLYAQFVSRQSSMYNAQLVQWAYQGDDDYHGKSLRPGANPDTYFDADTKQAIPEESLVSSWLARISGQKHGISPNSAPVLSLAVTYGRQTLVEELLTRGANVNAPDDKGSTPLHYAALHNQRDILITLLDHHADVNHANSAGQTALHIAVAQHNVVNAQLLLDRGANSNPADKAGQTPLDSIGFEAEDQHREWMLHYGENKLAPAKDLKETPQSITASYKRRLDGLRPLIVALQRSGAKMSGETQNRLAGSFDLNPREVDQALTAPDPTANPGKTRH